MIDDSANQPGRSRVPQNEMGQPIHNSKNNLENKSRFQLRLDVINMDENSSRELLEEVLRDG